MRHKEMAIAMITLSASLSSASLPFRESDFDVLVKIVLSDRGVSCVIAIIFYIILYS